MVARPLARIFHTLIAGSGDPAYRDCVGGVVGRLPSRGGVARIQAVCEISGPGLGLRQSSGAFPCGACQEKRQKTAAPCHRSRRVHRPNAR